MFNSKSYLYLFVLLIFAVLLGGCSTKDKVERARLLKTENATKEQLLGEINRFAKVSSVHAKMDLSFEDNSYAETGLTEKYKTADGDLVIQRPSDISLKVQVPIIKLDIAQMTSNGTNFRIAVLNDGGDGKNKKFIVGSNNVDYAKLKESGKSEKLSEGDKELLKKASAFANMRPQHFIDALLVRPTDSEHTYLQSQIVEDEVDPTARKKSPTARVLRGYYLLDELTKNANGDLAVTRRFWFDRVGGIRLARQQIFDAGGEIESDIVYGKQGNLSDNPDYSNLPLRVEVSRPKEKYKMSLTYQTPESVTLGKMYNKDVFVLKNSWNLPEVDLDKQAQSGQAQKSVIQGANANANSQ